MTQTEATIAELRSAFDSYLERQGRVDFGVRISELEARVHIECLSRGYSIVARCSPPEGVTEPISPQGALKFAEECVLHMDMEIMFYLGAPRAVNETRVKGHVDARLAMIVATQHEGDLK
jgi:hypothetical protein